MPGIRHSTVSAITLVTLILSSCAGQPRFGTWDYALKKNEAWAYDVYIEQNPDGPHLEQARRLYDLRAFETWSPADYLEAFPDGEHVAEATARYEPTMWSKIEANPTLDGYRHYLRTYPDGQFASDARAALEEFAMFGLSVGSLVHAGPARDRQPSGVWRYELILEETNGVGATFDSHHVVIPTQIGHRISQSSTIYAFRVEANGSYTYERSIDTGSPTHAGDEIRFFFGGVDDSGHPVSVVVYSTLPKLAD